MIIKAFKIFIGIEPNEEQDTKEERKKIAETIIIKKSLYY